jgi:hypothetical protein
MSGSILYRKHGKSQRISELRIDGHQAGLKYWSRVSGLESGEIVKRLKTMSPKEAVYGAELQIKPHNAWPVP